MDTCSFFPRTQNPQPVPTVPSNRQYKPESRELADWTTLGIGGRASEIVRATSEDEIVEAVRTADEEGREVLMLGGGSNLLVGDADFDGVVVRDMRSNYTLEHDSGCGGAVVRADAGMAWDDFVALAVENDWAGLEALSGIPGTVGASPVQNVGAYGKEVAETIAALRVYDRLEKRRTTLFLSDLEFGYRTSLLKRSIFDPTVSNGRLWGPTGRWIVLSVEFQFTHASLSLPIGYAQLAQRLGVAVGERADQRDVRNAVLELRRGKSMVLDDANRNSWSTGSFFTNPIVSIEEAERLPETAPRFPVRAVAPHGKVPDPNLNEPGVVKTSAAWLINHSGFDRGFKLHEGARAALSSDHVLAIANLGGARMSDVAELATAVREGVWDQWGIELVPEPVRVGWDLPALEKH